jgi:hypothetical protein
MDADRSDAAIVGRLIERTRLLIALSDDVPIETKLNTQALLKMFAAALVDADDDLQQQTVVRGYYARLYEDLNEYADLEALLSAMKVFLPYL